MYWSGFARRSLRSDDDTLRSPPNEAAYQVDRERNRRDEHTDGEPGSQGENKPAHCGHLGEDRR